MMHKSILMILKVPPPITGVTYLNALIIRSEKIEKKYNLNFIRISYSSNIRELGKIKISKIITYLWNFIYLLKILFREKIDLVYFPISLFGITFLRDYIYILLIKISGIKLLIHIHGKGIKKKANQSFIWRILYKNAFRNSYLICLSSTVADDVNTVYNLSPFIINNGIPKIVYTGKKIRFPKTTVLFLSNLLVSKGIYDFIDAFSHLNGYNIEGIIIGQDGDVTKNDLIDYISKIGINNKIEVLGSKVNTEKEEYLAKSDIFVYPTLNDAWGLVVLEAMNAALPVIATKEGSLPELVVNNVTGFLIDKNSPEQIAEKILYLHENSDRMLTMGIAGYNHFVKKYTFDIFENNFIDVLDTVISH